ncbi:MAG: thioredoxin family protein [Burkholderiales bacterium]|jgi:predicted DCC family thiol-disulfide oxidoreductase YuxK
MKTSLLAAAVAAFATTAAVAASLPPGFDDNPSVVEAVAKARTSGKPVIVYYTDQNCATCTALDGWLVRGDLRQAFAGSYHFTMVFADDLAPTERDRWKAAYVPRGAAPAWVVLNADGSYLCTAAGGFANAVEALELHKRLGRAVAARGGASAKTVSSGPDKPRACTDRALGLTPSET